MFISSYRLLICFDHVKLTGTLYAKPEACMSSPFCAVAYDVLLRKHGIRNSPQITQIFCHPLRAVSPSGQEADCPSGICEGFRLVERYSSERIGVPKICGRKSGVPIDQRRAFLFLYVLSIYWSGRIGRSAQWRSYRFYIKLATSVRFEFAVKV